MNQASKGITGWEKWHVEASFPRLETSFSQVLLFFVEKTFKSLSNYCSISELLLRQIRKTPQKMVDKSEGEYRDAAPFFFLTSLQWFSRASFAEVINYIKADGSIFIFTNLRQKINNFPPSWARQKVKKSFYFLLWRLTKYVGMSALSFHPQTS